MTSSLHSPSPRVFFSSLIGILGLLAPLLTAAPESDLATDAEKASSPQSPLREATLLFADETRITGRPQSIDGPRELLKLQSPSLGRDTVLKTDRLLELGLNGTPRELDSDHYAIATLKNHYNQNFHDSIRGRLLRLNDDTVTLETWYAGQLDIRRSLVKSLNIYESAPSFYEGPKGPEGWVAAEGDLEDSWNFDGRSMTSKEKVGIAREVEIPTKAKISFKASWKGRPYFRLLFFADTGSRSYSNEGYFLNFQTSHLSLYRNAKGNLGNNQNVMTQSIRNLFNAETATFTIFLDREKEGKNAIYINDEEIDSWTGVDDTVFEGKWLHFVPQTDGPQRFSQISVTQWDGNLPKGSDDEKKPEKIAPQPEKMEGQAIRLANGDLLVGTVEGIEKGLAKIATSFGPVKVPVRFMRSVNLVTEKDEVRMEKNDVRAWFHDGGYITLKLKSLQDDRIKGYSQAWGDAEFDLNAFSRIEFNIWRRELDTARFGNESEW